MGYTITLTIRATLRPEFIPYLQTMDYLWMDHVVDMTEEETETFAREHGTFVYKKFNPAIPEAFQKAHGAWSNYRERFGGFREYECNVETGIWQFQLSNRLWHIMHRDYLEFIREFVVLVTDKIHQCEIDDELGSPTNYLDEEMRYSPMTCDTQLRNRLKDVEDQLAHSREMIRRLTQQVYELKRQQLTAPQPSAHPPASSAP